MNRIRTLRFLIIAVIVGVSACVNQPTKTSQEVQTLINSAQSGDTEAQFQLGSAYDFGHGVRRDGKEAKRWYLLAAEAGHAEAQNSIGSGFQAEKNYKEAYKWYKKATDQNHALATNNLGYLYDLGLGVPQNRQKGYELYLKAANLGWAEAMFNIGQMYGSGQLGKVDIKEGCVWTLRANKYSESGVVKERAKSTANYCKQTLSKQEFVQVEIKADKWDPKLIAK